MIADRESDALVSHLNACRPDLVTREEQRWRSELGTILEQFDVASEG